MTGLLLALAIASSQQATQHANDACLKAIVYKESGNQSVRGISATRSVILNRARKSGKSVCSTVKRKGQFASYRRGMKLSKVKIPKKFVDKYRESAKMHVVGKDYLYFYRRDMQQPMWARGMKCKGIGDHFYCKLKEG